MKFNPIKLYPKDDKSKPYRFVKFFTFFSLIVIFIGTIILFMLNIHWARMMQFKKSEDYALLLVENLNHQIFIKFLLPVALAYGKIQLREKEQFERMDKVVRSTLHSFEVESVNIYDKNNVISYSFEEDLIGKEGLGGRELEMAFKGKPASRLVQRGNFIEIILGIPKESKLITFAPLKAEQPPSRIAGPVLGVIEIVQNISKDYKTIIQFQGLVIMSYTIVMGGIFLLLRSLVKKGEETIHKRNEEEIRLKEQLSKAERLSSLGEMAAGISHEIRNPLGIIRSSAELLKKKMAKLDPGNTIPEIIVEESTRVNKLISDFFNLAKPRKLNVKPCQIEAILEKNLAFLAPQIESNGYTVIRNFSPDLPEIVADDELLYQAFLNILINAMQAMPTGGEIYVELRSNHDYVVVIVEDEGEGIPDAIIDKIWNPFFTTKDKGTGLGLGIVKSMIESHGGRVNIRNSEVHEYKSGARVTVELPIKKLMDQETF